MYSVVEFDRKECSVVPFNWITEENKCFWPNCTKKEIFEELVASKQAPLSNWKKYSIKKIHRSFGSRSEAETFLNKIMEDSSSSDSISSKQTLTRKEIRDCTFDEDETPLVSKRQRNSPVLGSVKKNRYDNASSDEFSSEEDNNVASQREHELVQNNLNTEGLSELTLTNVSVSTVNNTIPSLAGSRIGTPRSTSGFSTPIPHNLDANVTELLLKRLEKVISVQEQHSVILDNILRNLHQKSNQILEKPQDFPNLPISNKVEFRAVEEFLSYDDKFSYMKKRLSTIGDCSVRNTTMNMLKFLLTNQVAMKFNWSGKDKRPFKKTNMCAVIIEAVKYSYTNGNVQDLSDKIIKESIQDWLKLAKSRYNYNLKKK